MDKTTKTIIIAGSSLLVASVGIGVYLHIKNKPKDEEPETLWESVKQVINLAPTSKPNCVKPIDTYPVRKGQKGLEVGKLQEFLNKFGGAKLSVDCHFGDKTQTALTNFAREKGYTDMITSVPVLMYRNIIEPSLRDGELRMGLWGW
jgi:hypothetical protein